jgi:GTP cyclohydrolase I
MNNPDPLILQTHLVGGTNPEFVAESVRLTLGFDRMVGDEKLRKDLQLRLATILLLDAIGEDLSRPGIQDTPKRVAKMWLTELATGLVNDPKRHLRTTFNEGHDEMVIIRDIPFYSYCEHHLVPFFGTVDVAYVPKDGRVVGLSKLARVLEDIARRPQVQENITSRMANVIMDELQPLGVGVVIRAEHMCMTMRGVEKPGSQTITSAVRGVFMDKPEVRAEFLTLLNHK